MRYSVLWNDNDIRLICVYECNNKDNAIREANYRAGDSEHYFVCDNTTGELIHEA